MDCEIETLNYAMLGSCQVTAANEPLKRCLSNPASYSYKFLRLTKYPVVRTWASDSWFSTFPSAHHKAEHMFNA